MLSLNIALTLQSNGVPGSGFPPVTTFIDQLSNPTSASRPAPLTPAGFAAAYGPTTTDYKNLTSFATANGLTVARTFTARNMLAFDRDRAAIENAFFVTLNVYRRPDGTTSLRRRTTVHQPGASVASIPSSASRAWTTSRRPSTGREPRPGTCNRRPLGPRTPFMARTSRTRTSPACASRLGQGQDQTVALFEDDSYIASDILAFTQGTLLGETALNVPANLTNVTQEVAPLQHVDPVRHGHLPTEREGNSGRQWRGGAGHEHGPWRRATGQSHHLRGQQSLPLSTRSSGRSPMRTPAQTISSSWYWGFSTENEQLTVQSVLYQYAARVSRSSKPRWTRAHTSRALCITAPSRALCQMFRSR